MKEVRESKAAGRIAFTVRLPEPLIQRAKEYCIANRETLQDFTEESLTKRLDELYPVSGRRKPSPSTPPPATPPSASHTAISNQDTRIERIERNLEALTELLAGVVEKRKVG